MKLTPTETALAVLEEIGLLPVADELRHLICVPYSVANLHKLAAAFNIGRHWYHSGGSDRLGIAHYDIPRQREGEICGRSLQVGDRTIVNIARGLGE